MTLHINIIKQQEEEGSSSWLMHLNFNSSAAYQQPFYLHVIIPLQYKYQTENSKAA